MEHITTCIRNEHSDRKEDEERPILQEPKLNELTELNATKLNELTELNVLSEKIDLIVKSLEKSGFVVEGISVEKAVEDVKGELIKGEHNEGT